MKKMFSIFTCIELKLWTASPDSSCPKIIEHGNGLIENFEKAVHILPKESRHLFLPAPGPGSNT